MKENNKKLSTPICTICHTVFDSYYHNPRIVSKCGHTFCQKCIIMKSQIKSNKKVFICIQCNSEIVIRKSIQEQFPKNISILQIIKDIKKQSFQSECYLEMCQEHNKPLDLKCQSCNQKRICSHCALFGSHKSHKFSNCGTINQKDLQQLQQSFQILTETVQQTILSKSPINILKRCKTKLKQNLQRLIKNHFQQYYQPIQRKQQQLLRQCQQIEIDGNISNTIDNILHSYDLIKIQIDNYQKLINIDKIINKCKLIHQEIQCLCKFAQDKIKNTINDVNIKIGDTLFIKVQNMPVNLKSLFKRDVTPQKVKSIKNIQSPIMKQNKQKSPFERNKYTIASREIKTHLRRDSDIGTDKEGGSHTDRETKKAKDIYGPTSSKELKKIDNQSLLLDFQELDKKQKSPAPFPPRETFSKSTIPQLKIPLPGRKTQKFSSNHKQNQKKIQIKKQQTQRSLKQQQKPTQLKYIRPTKQINYDYRSKLQQILTQIDRQQGNIALQLISMQINDTLLWYLLEHMRVKNCKFSMMKFVKNNITDQGFKLLLGYLLKDNYTKVLNMTSNHISLKGLSMILQLAQENKILNTIYLSNNKITNFHIKNRKNQLEKFGLQIIL